MVFLEDRTRIVRWKIFREFGCGPWFPKSGSGFGCQVAGPSVTLFCPFRVKHRKGQEEKVFLPFPSCTCGHTARTRGPSSAPRTSWAS